MRIASERKRASGDVEYLSPYGEEVSVSRYNGEPIGGGEGIEYVSVDVHLRALERPDPQSFILGSGVVTLSVGGSTTLYLSPDQYREVRDLMTRTIRKLR